MLDSDILVLDMLDMVVMDLAMAVLAMLVLDTLGMVVMDLDTVLDMDVPSTVKQLIYTSKSSKQSFGIQCPLLGRNFLFHVQIE